MKPWMRSRLRTADIRLGPGRGVVSLYSEIMPHMITRPKSLRRGKTACCTSPPTFSKYTSIPLGHAPASAAFQIGAAMIERCIEAKFVLDIAALFGPAGDTDDPRRSEEHTSELQSPYVISYAVFC